jgi:hypothetical protein
MTQVTEDRRNVERVSAETVGLILCVSLIAVGAAWLGLLGWASWQAAKLAF